MKRALKRQRFGTIKRFKKSSKEVLKKETKTRQKSDNFYMFSNAKRNKLRKIAKRFEHQKDIKKAWKKVKKDGKRTIKRR